MNGLERRYENGEKRTAELKSLTESIETRIKSLEKENREFKEGISKKYKSLEDLVNKFREESEKEREKIEELLKTIPTIEKVEERSIRMLTNNLRKFGSFVDEKLKEVVTKGEIEEYKKSLAEGLRKEIRTMVENETEKKKQEIKAEIKKEIIEEIINRTKTLEDQISKLFTLIQKISASTPIVVE